MRNIIWMAVAVIFMTLPVQAQDFDRFTIEGTVQNQAGEPLPGATVMLLNAADSVLLTFAASRNDGRFVLKQNGAGDAIVQITYIGFNTWSKQLTLGPVEEMDLGLIVMGDKLESLQEVEVVGEYVPVQIKKDTIQYNADAFKTQPNEVVEELLKKLPGIEVESDGTIKAQGEEVERVLVDGKDFFGGDPKTATKNLPANAVDKVKVFDAMSEMANFSGIDDGQRTKTIDLTLKEDRKNGMFGTIEGGYGSDDRYNGKLNINRFSKKSQFSVLGMANNINEQGFSVQEFVNFSGGMQALARGGGRRMSIGGSNSTVPISNGLSNGDVSTIAGGLNWNIDLSKNTDLRSSYFVNVVDNEISQQISRENFLPDDRSFITTEDQFQDSEGANHRLNVNLRHKIDSTQNIQFTTSARYNDGTYRSFLESIQNRSEAFTDNNSSSNSWNVNSNLIYRKKLQKPGRILSAQVGFQYGDQNQDADLNSLITFTQSGLIEEIIQERFLNDDNLTYSGRISYMEPLGGGKYLEGNYRREYVLDDNSTDVFDDVDGQLIMNDNLSNAYERLYTYDVGGLNLRWNTNFMSLTAGADIQHSRLEGTVLGEEVNDRTFTNLLPSMSARFTLSSMSNITTSYRTSLDAPTLEQLQPVPDNSDPQSIFIGNPDLDPAFIHRVNVRYMSFSQFSYTSVFANITGSLTRDRIINARSFNEFNQLVTTPVNIDLEKSLSGYVGFGTQLRSINGQINVNVNTSLTNSQVFINDAFSDLNRWTQGIGFSLRNRNIEVVEWSIGSNLSRTDARYKELSENDQVFWNQRYEAALNLNFLKTWSIDNQFTYSRFTGDAFESVQDLALLNITLSKFVFDDKRGQIKLSVFDLLNQNKGISRNTDINYIEDVTSNSLRRYVMLSFLYSIRSIGGGGGVRDIFRMR